MRWPTPTQQPKSVRHIQLYQNYNKRRLTIQKSDAVTMHACARPIAASARGASLTPHAVKLYSNPASRGRIVECAILWHHGRMHARGLQKLDDACCSPHRGGGPQGIARCIHAQGTSRRLVATQRSSTWTWVPSSTSRTHSSRHDVGGESQQREAQLLMATRVPTPSPPRRYRRSILLAKCRLLRMGI